MLKVFATPRCGVNFWAQGVVSQVHFLLISSAGLRIIACYTSRLFHQHFWQIDFEPKFWPFRFCPITICPHWDFESSALEDALLFAASLRPNDGILGCSLLNSTEYGHGSPYLRRSTPATSSYSSYSISSSGGFRVVGTRGF